MAQDRPEPVDTSRWRTASDIDTRAILDNVFAFVVLLDPTGVVLDINKAPLEAGGHDRDSIVGRLAYDTPWWSHDPSSRAQLMAAIAIAARGERVRFDADVAMGDGVSTIDVQISPLKDSDGQVRHLVASAVDITDRKRVENALLRQMEILDQAQSVARMGSWTYDFETGEAIASDAVRRLIGLKPGEHLTPESYRTFNHPDDRDRVSAAWQAVLNGDEQGFIHRNVIDGRLQWIDSRVRISYDDTGAPKFAIGTIQDITEQKSSEERVKEYQESLEDIIEDRTHELNDANRKLSEIVFALESVGTAIFWNDAETARFTAVNQHAADMLGYPVEELIGRTVPDIDPNFSMEQYSQILPTIREQGFIRFETVQKRKNGDLIPVEMTVYQQPSIPGQPDRLLSFGLEIAERKAAERALLEAKTAAEAASAAKSAFLATVSHEIRTPMNAIIGMARLAMKTDLSEQQEDYLEKILASSQLLLSVINDILDFSKIEADRMILEHKAFELVELFEKVIPQIEETAHAKNLELLIDVSRDTPTLFVGDELRLGQILLNLSSNAVKFTESGEISIRVRPLTLEIDEAVIRFEIADSGIGLTAAQIASLFQSFHQADSSITRKYGGSGLGLAISKRLVELMGGEIGVESVPGEGSVFWFTIKVKTGRPQRPAPRGTGAFRGVRALVMDDHPMARELLTTFLEQLSLEVTSVHDGKAGVEELLEAAQRGAPYELAFIDQVMPGMSGVETARCIAELRLKTPPKAILLSGQSSAKLSRHVREAGFEAVLHKPISPTRLLEMLTRCLEIGGADDRSPEPAAATRCIDATRIVGARALLVEDNELNQEVATAFLRDAGLVVDVATNGLQAVEMVQRSSYEIVLMDMQMPEMDGLSATREIRRMPGFACLPIVAMTANAMAVDRERCLAAGMNDHIAKPIDPDTLIIKLLQWIKTNHGSDASLNVSPRGLDATTEALTMRLRLFRNIAGLDVDSGLARCLSRGSLYLSLLRRFVDEQQDVLPRINLAITSGEMELAERLAHTLKGVAAQIGADRVSDCAGRLERQLGTPADRKILEQSVAELRSALGPLIEDLRRRRSLLEPEEQASATDFSEWGYVRDALANLLFEADVACLELFSRNRSLIREALGPAFVDFARSVEAFDFPSALDILNGRNGTSAGGPDEEDN